MRILFLTPYLPSPPRFGGQARIHGLMTGLASSHELSILSLVDSTQDQSESVAAMQRYCKLVIPIPNHLYGVDRRAKRLLQLGSFCTPYSYERLQHLTTVFEYQLRCLLQNERFDIVHFGHGHMAPYLMRIRSWQRNRRKIGGLQCSRHTRFVLDEHNIEFDILHRTAQQATGALRKVYSAVNWRKLRSEECQAWRVSDGCTLTSGRDERILKSLVPDARTIVVPNAVDEDYFKPGGHRSARPMTLLFFGAINYYPNTDGLLYFLDEIFPRLKERHPAMEIRIVGHRPPDLIRKRAGGGVSVIGFVDDLRPYIEQAALVIAPLRIGGGTRLKILEAMAMGKPVVSTAIGAEGLDVEAERDILIADDSLAFANQVSRLLDDPALARRLGDAARKLVEERYTWRTSVAKLSGFYGDLLAEDGEPAT